MVVARVHHQSNVTLEGAQTRLRNVSLLSGTTYRATVTLAKEEALCR